MAIDVHCPNCQHFWEEDYFEEADLDVYKEQIEAKDQVITEMREFMKGFVDEFDKVPSTYSVTRTLTKAEVQTMRRLVERIE